MPLSVLVVGSARVRAGLCALLAQEEDFALGGAEMESGVVLWERPLPDVIVCCSASPKALRAGGPQTGVFVVANLAPTIARENHELGADGLHPFTAEPDDLIWAVHSIAQGRYTLHPIVMHVLVACLAEAMGAPPSPTPVPLTDREREVLRHLTRGASAKEIAQRLHLSARTVRSHLARLCPNSAILLKARQATWRLFRFKANDRLRRSMRNELARRRVAAPGTLLDATPAAAGACWIAGANVWRSRSGRLHPVITGKK